MKKITGILFLTMVLGSVAMANSEQFVIDKEVTGVNKEVLENTTHNNAKVNIDNKQVIIKNSDITNDNLKNQKQVITVKEDTSDLNESLKDKGTPIWKYIIGAVALVVLGVAL
ncbi:MAG: hypothetical protein ACRC1R_06085 [Cetobacterium sp.]|uniref:hypothetical protein n=1 Tax=Cetobacterium sp. TaxID=2071632 RepID=UPI003F2A6212